MNVLTIELIVKIIYRCWNILDEVRCRMRGARIVFPEYGRGFDEIGVVSEWDDQSVFKIAHILSAGVRWFVVSVAVHVDWRMND